jgi:hypothetical protein
LPRQTSASFGFRRGTASRMLRDALATDLLRLFG